MSNFKLVVSTFIMMFLIGKYFAWNIYLLGGLIVYIMLIQEVVDRVKSCYVFRKGFDTKDKRGR